MSDRASQFSLHYRSSSTLIIGTHLSLQITVNLEKCLHSIL